jgi:outer membrane protein TolC
VEKSKVLLNQIIDNFTSLEDSINLEIISNYQTLLASAANIETSTKAIAAGDEGVRVATELFQEDMATYHAVLDALALRSKAEYDHFNALYNYNLAWATLERTMGQRVAPVGQVR